MEHSAATTLATTRTTGLAAPIAPPGAPASLAAAIAQLLPHVPEVLLAPAAAAAILQAMRSAPRAIGPVLYLETRLAPGNAPVDVVAMVDRASAHAHQREPHPADAGWNSLARLVHRWLTDHASPLAAIDHLWYEYDVDPQRDAGAPGVFVSFGEQEPFARPWQADTRASTTATLLDVLGVDPVAAVRSTVAHILDALPANVSCPHLGVMHGRPHTPVRLCLVGLHGRARAEFLRTIGWPGDVAALEARLARLEASRPVGPWHRAGMLHLDLADGVLPRLGIEYMHDRIAQVHGRFDEQAFLEAIVADGLASAEKVAALAAWPGHALWRDHRVLPERAAGVHATAIGRRATPVTRHVCIRRLNHVKLVVNEGRWEAKGYLSATSHPLDAHGRLVPFDAPRDDGPADRSPHLA
jgi:hypothetical protein